MNDTLKNIHAMSPADIEEAKKHIMVGGGTPGPTLVRGKGIWLEDYDGKQYIDCTSQSWTMYLGYANKEINSVIQQAAENFSHVHQGFDTLPRYYLAKKLTELAPSGLNRVSFTVGGGPAVEAAMKISLKNRPGARDFISLYDAYHGSISSAASQSWIATQASGKFTGQKHFIPLLNSAIRIPNPYCYRCIFNLGPETCDLMCAEMLYHTILRGVNGLVAGVILEPLQASGGQIPFPKRYLVRIREICDEFGIPLIFDEIQTFCRIGEWFASTHYDVVPDIICLGKGLGAGLPIAAILVHDKFEGFSLHAEELHTFANNSLSQVCAIKQIEIIQRDKVLENTKKIGQYITSRLQSLQEEFPEMGDIRAVGLHIGVEFIEDTQTRTPAIEKTIQIREEGIANGVIFGLGGARKNVLKIKPPLIIKQDEADMVIERLKKAMTKVLR